MTLRAIHDRCAAALRSCLEALARGEAVCYVCCTEEEAKRFFDEIKHVAENAPPPFVLSNFTTKVLT